jgi:hypothetical protein
LDRASVELEAIAMDGYNLWGVIDDPSQKKKEEKQKNNCYEGRVNDEWLVKMSVDPNLYGWMLTF